jgi:hypothetical protein
MYLLMVAGIIVVLAIAYVVLPSVVTLGFQVGLTNYGPVLIGSYFVHNAVAGLPTSAALVLTVLALLVFNDYWSRIVARVEYVRIAREKLQLRVLDTRDQRHLRLQHFAS